MSRTESALNSRAKTLFLSAFGASLALHGVAYASLASGTFDPPPPIVVSTVTFEVKAPPPPEPEAPQPREATPSPTVNPTPTRAASRALELPTPPPATTAAAAAAAAPAPAPNSPALDLSGVTLTNDTDSGFAMPIGDGTALRGPIGLGGAPRGAASPASAQPTGALAGPRLVAGKDLSEHPHPPALEGLLRANYPDDARQRGLRGSASVRARIDSDGVIRAARVVGESSTGFGSACRRTVVGSRWSAPRAQNGDAVATEIVYTCHFEVD
jgi:TonB family protein